MKHPDIFSNSADIQILKHHIYEYKKGVRNLILHTMKKEEVQTAEIILKNKKIDYHIEEVTQQKINIFLGDPKCIEIICSFNGKTLDRYTPEQDFMLGIMLGYDRSQQFDRYIKRVSEKKARKITTLA